MTPGNGRSPTGAPARWLWLGRVPFAQTALVQERLREAIFAGEAPETLLLCEHDPVITLGRHARPEHLLLSEAELATRGIALCHASRGGDVTYHGPGQLVAYPIFRLASGLVHHFEGMSAAVVSLLASFGLRAEWRRDEPGVWIGNDKICAFGVHVRHRIAMHGLALNVSTDLAAFETIVPCGLRHRGVTSIARLRAEVPPVAALAGPFASAFEKAFARPLVEEPSSALSRFSIANSKTGSIQ